MASRIKILVNLNLLWSEFVETMRRFDLLLQILVTHRLSVTWPRYQWKDLFLATGHSVSMNNNIILSGCYAENRSDTVVKSRRPFSTGPHHESWSGIRTAPPPPPHLHPDPSAGIWVKSQTTYAWPRSVEADRNVASFQQTRSKVSLNWLILFQCNCTDYATGLICVSQTCQVCRIPVHHGWP